MKIDVQNFSLPEISADLLAVPVFEGQKKFSGAAGLLDKALKGELSAAAGDLNPAGAEGEALEIRVPAGAGTRKIILLGIGRKPFGAKAARLMAARAASAARKRKAKRLIMILPDGIAAGAAPIGQAAAEGLLLGEYRFLKYKDQGKNNDAPAEVCVLLADRGLVSRLRRGVARGELAARATIMARDMVNEPASHMTPRRLVEIAQSIAAAAPKNISLKLFDEKELKKMKAGGLLAVGRGSDEPSYLVHLAYRPKKAKKRVVLVGKGVTFDSGGLSLKPAQHMEDMKIDMAGAAAVFAVFGVLAELEPDVEVHGLAGLCENMPSGKAIRPGDIVKTMSGKTIEILNTDAEGRVTLADTLHYGAELKPDIIIDVATLTGACMVALGQEVAGLMSNSKPLALKLAAAAERAGELVWQLPLVDEYRQSMKSLVADLKNIGGGSYGGAITAGLFLEEFVGKKTWAHLDIAGPAWAERDTIPYQPRGATGFGVRTLLEFISSLN